MMMAAEQMGTSFPSPWMTPQKARKTFPSPLRAKGLYPAPYFGVAASLAVPWPTCLHPQGPMNFPPTVPRHPARLPGHHQCFVACERHFSRRERALSKEPRQGWTERHLSVPQRSLPLSYLSSDQFLIEP